MVWDISRGQIACELGTQGTGHSSAVRSVSFAGPTRLLSVGDDRQAIVWDCGPAACPLSRFECQTAGPALSVVGTPESGIIVGGALLAEWEAMTGKQTREFAGGHAAPVSMLSFVGSALASSAGDRFVCVWCTGDVRDILSAPLPLAKLCGGAVGAAAISEDGSRIFFWADEAAPNSGKKSKKGSVSANKAREPSFVMEAGLHPALDVRWSEGAVLVARLMAGRPQFVRVAPGDALPTAEMTGSGTGEKGLGALVRPTTFDGKNAFTAASFVAADASAGRSVGAGAGTVVGIIRQALLTRDNVLLGEALESPVKVEDSCRALDPRLAAPLLAALSHRLELGRGDTRTLEWVRGVLKEHRTSIGQDSQGSIETLRSICDRSSHSLKRLLRLKGKLEMLEARKKDNEDDDKLQMLVWDEREEDRAPMDIDDDDEDEGDSESNSDASDDSDSSDSE